MYIIISVYMLSEVYTVFVCLLACSFSVYSSSICTDAEQSLLKASKGMK